MSENLIECTKCGWQGDPGMLICTAEDGRDMKKPIEQISFNICPECGAVDCCEDCDDA